MLEIKSIKTAIFGPLSLNVASGKCAVIRGQSGCGKTLFFRAIADLDPNEGTILLNGAARADMPANQWRLKMGLVPAESGWWAETVGEHFFSDTAPDDILQSLGLPVECLGWKIDRLSTGERQRLAIARAVALCPQAIMLDEPTAALDPASTKKVEQLISGLLEKGTAVLMVTHSDDQAERMADEVFVMANGKLIAQQAKPRKVKETAGQGT